MQKKNTYENFATATKTSLTCIGILTSKRQAYIQINKLSFSPDGITKKKNKKNRIYCTNRMKNPRFCASLPDGMCATGCMNDMNL